MIDLKSLQKSYKKFKTRDIVTTLPSQNAGYYNYEAVQYSVNRPYVWAPLYQDHREQLTYSDRLQLLKVSNFLELNFPQYQELINCIARFGVGRGIIPTSATTNSTYNSIADLTFAQWAENRFCDVERQKNFYQFTRYIAERLVADGEIFVLLTTSASGYPRLQSISPLRVRTSKDQNDKSIDGIWYSDLGEPVAYNIFNLEDPGVSRFVDGSYQKITADNVIHIFNPIASTQGHGIPWAQSSFNDMRDVKDAMSLTMNAVKNEALFSMQYQDTTGKGGPVTVDGMAGQKYKPAGATELPNGQPSPNRKTITNPDASVNINNPSYLEQLSYGSKNKIVNVGYGELKPVLATRPADNFSTFIELNYRGICQSVGIPYEFTYCPEKLDNKGGEIIIEKVNAFFAEFQELIIDSFCHRVYGWVLSKQLNLKDVRPLGNENPFLAHWTTPKRVGTGRNDVANRIDAIQNKLSNPYIDASAQGLDADQIADGWILYQKKFNDKCKAAGVDPTTIAYGKATTSMKQTEAVTDEDANNDKEKED